MLKNKEQFIREQKEYASLLGIPYDRYVEINNKIKITEEPKRAKNSFNDDILERLNLTSKDLKKQRKFNWWINR